MDGRPRAPQAEGGKRGAAMQPINRHHRTHDAKSIAPRNNGLLFGRSILTVAAW
jgi:hypothetical protein